MKKEEKAIVKTTPSHIPGTEKKVDIDELEKDPDDEVHNQSDLLVQPGNEQDPDDLVHKQRKPQADENEELDIDDLMHRK